MPNPLTNDVNFNGHAALNALMTMPITSIAAAGNNQSNATALSAGLNLASGSDGVKGVILIAGGKLTLVWNTGSFVLPVYPPSGASVKGGGSGAVNAPVWCPAGLTWFIGDGISGGWRSGIVNPDTTATFTNSTSPGGTAAITAWSNDGTDYTFTTANDLFVTGSNVFFNGVTDSGGSAINNGTFTVTRTSVGHYTLTGAGKTGSPSGGTANGYTLTAIPNAINLIDTSAGPVALLMPIPNTTQFVAFLDVSATFDSNNFTAVPNAFQKIAGVAASFVANARGTFFTLASDCNNWNLPTSPTAHTTTNKSGAYTLKLTDAGQTLTNSGASNTITIDSNANVAYPITPDGAITIVNKATTPLTIAVTGSATINGANANRTVAASTTGVYPTVSIWPIAADTWIMVGNYS
jgi:hypothetical protein